MSNESLESTQFVASLEAELNRLDTVLDDIADEIHGHNSRLRDAQDRAESTRRRMQAIRRLIVDCTGEDPPDDDGVTPDENARHAVICLLASARKELPAKQIVEDVGDVWDHSAAAVRSALVRAVADGDVDKIDRGLYRLSPNADPDFAEVAAWWAQKLSEDRARDRARRMGTEKSPPLR